MLKYTPIKVNIPVLYLKEGEAFICYSPVFDLAAHGDSFKDAEQSFAKTLKLFVEHVSKKKTWRKVLQLKD
jgi:predicted RNase H-like HicB family nuclease